MIENRSQHPTAADPGWIAVVGLDKKSHSRRRIRGTADVERRELVRKSDARGYRNETTRRLSLLIRRGATLAFFHGDLALRRTRYPRADSVDIPDSYGGRLRFMDLATTDLSGAELHEFLAGARKQVPTTLPIRLGPVRA